jgi:hypothetical protein
MSSAIKLPTCRRQVFAIAISLTQVIHSSLSVRQSVGFGSDDNLVRRDILRDDGSSGDDRVATDRNPPKYHGTSADPCAVIGREICG